MTLNCPWVPKNKMSSLIFAHAKSILKKADKLKFNELKGLDDKTTEQLRLQFIEQQLNEFDKILDLSEELHKRYKERMKNEKITRSYFITIRPKPEIEWETFYHIIEKYMKRKTFIEATYSYEQKGLNESELGKGFHVHIICKSTWRSIPEVLRDTTSSVGSICGPSGIDVTKIWNESQWNNCISYISDYTSDDNHKEITKVTDKLWREKNNLMPLYIKNHDVNSLLPSPGQQRININES